MNIITITILIVVFIAFFSGSFFASKYILDLLEEQNELLRKIADKNS